MRNIGALTEDECTRLRNSTVFVAGCGGLGGYLIDMLLRLGVGCIKAADKDVFEATNLNRQILCSTLNLGQSKVEAAAHYAEAVNPDVCFIACDAFLTESNADELICGCDIVLDGLDNIPSRLLLKAACDRQRIPYIYGAVSGWSLQAALSMPGDGLLERLYPAGTAEGSKGVPVFTPALCASLQTALCVRCLCGRDVEAGKLCYFDLEEIELEKLF